MALAVIAASGTANATMVYVNSPDATATTGGTKAVQARYRLSNTNFDQALYNGGSEGVGANSLQKNHGNVAALSGDTLSFSLSHEVGKGFTFGLSSAPGALPAINWTQAWGTGTGDQVAASLNGVAPGASFNVLNLWAKATVAGSVTVTDLVFSGATLSGSFTDPQTAASLANQYIISDTDLSSFTWSLSGKVTLVKSGTGSDEGIVFDISGRQETVTVVPEPSTYVAGALAVLPLLVGGVRKWRQNRANKA